MSLATHPEGVNERRPFGARLHELLERQGRTQAWLADTSNLDRSLVSRLIKGDRLPTSEALRSLAPVLEVDVTDLVLGTDAEDRLAEATNYVRRSDHEEALATIIDFEHRNRELSARVRSLTDTLNDEQLARDRAEKLAAESGALRAQIDVLKADVETKAMEVSRYQAALARAIAEFGTLRQQLGEVQAELGHSKASTHLTTVLAGIAAATGVASLAHFLRDETDQPKRKKSRRKQQV